MTTTETIIASTEDMQRDLKINKLLEELTIDLFGYAMRTANLFITDKTTRQEKNNLAREMHYAACCLFDCIGKPHTYYLFGVYAEIPESQLYEDTTAEKLLNLIRIALNNYVVKLAEFPNETRGMFYAKSRLMHEMIERATFIKECLASRTYKTRQDLDREAAEVISRVLG